MQDIAAIVSGAVVEGLKVAGILPDVPADKEKEDANPAASVQGSVAAVIQDITGEKHPPLLDKSNSSSNPSPLVMQPMASVDNMRASEACKPCQSTCEACEPFMRAMLVT